MVSNPDIHFFIPVLMNNMILFFQIIAIVEAGDSGIAPFLYLIRSTTPPPL
jgi:hypothetical protein